MARRLEKIFAKIYDKNIELIYRFIFLKTSSKEVAEDLTSQVFAKAWKKFQSQQETIQNISAYLFQIARAEVANYYRSASRLPLSHNDSLEQLEKTADSAQNPEQRQVQESWHFEIKQAMHQLSEEEQNILFLHYVEGMPFKKISEILGRPENTTRVMAHRSLKNLRDILENKNKN